VRSAVCTGRGARQKRTALDRRKRFQLRPLHVDRGTAPRHARSAARTQELATQCRYTRPYATASLYLRTMVYPSAAAASHLIGLPSDRLRRLGSASISVSGTATLVVRVPSASLYAPELATNTQPPMPMAICLSGVMSRTHSDPTEHLTDCPEFGSRTELAPCSDWRQSPHRSDCPEGENP
jgi:hypothetical protein